jgi:hypothetical protein
MNKARNACRAPARRRTVVADASTAVPMVGSMATANGPLRGWMQRAWCRYFINSAPPLSRARRAAPVEPKFGPKGLR